MIWGLFQRGGGGGGAGVPPNTAISAPEPWRAVPGFTRTRKTPLSCGWAAPGEPTPRLASGVCFFASCPVYAGDRVAGVLWGLPGRGGLRPCHPGLLPSEPPVRRRPLGCPLGAGAGPGGGEGGWRQLAARPQVYANPQRARLPPPLRGPSREQRRPLRGTQPPLSARRPGQRARGVEGEHWTLGAGLGPTSGDGGAALRADTRRGARRGAGQRRGDRDGPPPPARLAVRRRGAAVGGAGQGHPAPGAARAARCLPLQSLHDGMAPAAAPGAAQVSSGGRRAGRGRNGPARAAAPTCPHRRGASRPRAPRGRCMETAAPGAEPLLGRAPHAPGG